MQLRLPETKAPQSAARSAEILRAVRTAFVQKGFDGASMQDLARAAGISVGNFYRYFPSKEAIIVQMIALDLADIQSEFALVLQSHRPMDALRALIVRRMQGELCPQRLGIPISAHKSAETGQLWAEIAATAQRKPEIAACAVDMEDAVIDHLCEVFAAETGLSVQEARSRFAAEAGYIILLIRSAAMMVPNAADKKSLNISNTSTHLNLLILRTISQVLDDIASVGSKG